MAVSRFAELARAARRALMGANRMLISGAREAWLPNARRATEQTAPSGGRRPTQTTFRHLANSTNAVYRGDRSAPMKGYRVMTESALKDMIEPGTHRCTWTLSKPPDETTWETPGDVILLGARQPAGGVYGRAPVNVEATPGGGNVIALYQ